MTNTRRAAETVGSANRNRLRRFQRRWATALIACIAALAWTLSTSPLIAAAATDVPLEPIDGSPGIPAIVYYGLGAMLLVGVIVLFLLRKRR